MPLDPVIAGGFRGLQLQDPLEQYGRISQIQQAQQQNQLAALKMQEYQREVETENRLRALYQRAGADIRSPEFLREVYAVSPAKGAAMQKSAFEAEKEKRLSDAAMEDLAAKRIANARQMLPSVTPATWGAWRAETIKKLPGLENMIPEVYSDDAKAQLMQNADQYLASVKPMVVAPGASVFKPGSTTPMFTAPVAPVKPTPAETEEIVLRLQDPNLPPASRKALQDRLRILTTREPKEPREAPAPSITQIQDPTDSNRMITIDARRYAGGGVGSPGVIGTTGKTAPIAAADQKKLEGQQSAADIIDTLRAAYQDLDQRRAVPSEQRSVLSNLTSYIASTGVGQVAGRMAGTPEQTQRDVIQSARNQILNAVKNATGMSAQQLNSNVEFKSWVESLTDPTKSYQANTAILDNLEKFIASGGKYSAKKSGGAVTPAPASDLAAERENARSAIAAGAPEAAVRKRFKEKTGQEL